MMSCHSFRSRVSEGESIVMSIFNFDHCSGVDLDYSVVKSKDNKIRASTPRNKAHLYHYSRLSGSIKVSEKMPTYPSPKPTFCLK